MHLRSYTRLPDRTLVRFFLILLASAPLRAAAEQPSREPTCLRYDGRYQDAPLMRVGPSVSQGKVHFLKEARACPKTGSCPWQQRAYLVPGDVVFVGPEVEGYRCAYFGTVTGDIVAGFLPVDALDAAQDGGALDPEFLRGTWTWLG